MSGLVQCAHQRLGEIGLVVSGGEPHIIRDAAAERVAAFIEPAMREVEADALHQREGGATLQGDRERSGRHEWDRARRLTGQRRIEQPGEEPGDLVEQPVDQRRRAAGLVLIEQCLVRGGAERLRLGGGHLARQVEHAFQARQGQREIVGRTGRAPHRLGLRFGARQCLDEIARHRGGMAPTAAHLAQVGLLPKSEIRFLGLRGGEQIGDLGRGEQLMGDAAQGRELLGACRGAARRHHRRGVPMQHRNRLLDRAEAAKPRFEIGVRAHAAPLPGQW